MKKNRANERRGGGRRGGMMVIQYGGGTGGGLKRATMHAIRQPVRVCAGLGAGGEGGGDKGGGGQRLMHIKGAARSA